jgi:protein-L-isoaspartate O-methyltransferase
LLVLEQLKSGGKMVLSVGVKDEQKLVVVEKGDDHQVRTRELIAVRFSPQITSRWRAENASGQYAAQERSR